MANIALVLSACIGTHGERCPVYDPPPVVGYWSQFAEQISILQAEYHGYDPGGYYVALPDCNMVGQWVRVSVEGSKYVTARVFDCLGSDGDPNQWGPGKWIGELNYNLAERFDVIGRGAKGRLSMKKIKFGDVKIGEWIKQHPDAEAWDKKTGDVPSPRVKSGKTNVVGDEGVRAYISPDKEVWQND